MDVYSSNPYGTASANVDVAPGPEDIALLQKCPSVAAIQRTPFIDHTSARSFGTAAFLKVPGLRDLKSLFEGPHYARWHSFRESEDARYVGLCMPRFLLRLPYGEKTISVKSFNFNEDVVGNHDRYLWGHASVALTSRIVDSF